MQVIIESVSDVKTDQRGTSSKIKCSDGQSYYVNEDGTPLVGKTVELTSEEKTSAKGNKYKIGKIVKVLEGAAAPSSNGKVSWDEYKDIARAAHVLALELEPDVKEADMPVLDRSAARVAFVQTILVALRDGRIALPKVEDGEDNIPF